MTIRCVAIDDEPEALKLIEHYASRVPFLKWMGGCRQPLESLPLLNEGVDLLFLDINLSTIDGLSFYKSLVVKPSVIFTTAYSEHAAESYTMEAVDYLVKPIAFDRFLQATNKALQRMRVQEKLPASENDSIYIKSGPKWHQLRWADVHYLEKSENYVVFHLENGKKILTRQNMQDVEQTMPVSFHRIHKSFIVNLDKISVVERDKVNVQGASLSLADSYRDGLMKRLGLAE